MIIEAGNWIYYPTDDWPAIVKLKRHTLGKDGRPGFINDRIHLDRKLNDEFDRFSPMDDFGEGFVVRTKEEKHLLELLVL